MYIDLGMAIIGWVLFIVTDRMLSRRVDKSLTVPGQ